MADRFIVGPASAGMRLDRFLVDSYPGRSRRRVRAVIDAGEVRVGGKRARAGEVVAAGDEVVVATPPPDDAALRPAPEPEVPLVVLYEDAALLALAKPAGVPTHPLRAGEKGALASALVARFPECQGVGDDPREAGMAHRLDIDTSGAVLAARTDAAWRALRAQFREHRVIKRYLAMCSATPELAEPAHVGSTGQIAAPIAHDRSDRRRARVCGPRDHESVVKYKAQEALTEYRIVREIKLPRREGPLWLVEATAQTGRMHQVRAHLAYVGLPLVGDALYGAGAPTTPFGERHFLHAESIELDHPTTGARLTVKAPVPVVARWIIEG